MSESAEIPEAVPSPYPDDSELMSRVREADEEAFETIVRRYEDRVFNLAMRIIGIREEAREAAQDIFIQLWENPGAWKPSARFTTWLYRVTMNRSLNRLRKMKLKSLLSLSDFEPEGFPATGSTDTPEGGLIRDEETLRFTREFDSLPPRQKAALHLRYMENLSVSEVAAALGTSLKSAESLIFRGKQTLRERLKKD